MGYYTVFNLETKLTEEEGKILTEICKFNILDYLEGEESIKWYNCIDNMIAFSLQCPNKEFILWGDGEDPDDIWVKVFRNGFYGSDYVCAPDVEKAHLMLKNSINVTRERHGYELYP